MKYYRIEYPNGEFKLVEAKSALEVVKMYDLTSRENVNTKIIEVE